MRKRLYQGRWPREQGDMFVTKSHKKREQHNADEIQDKDEVSLNGAQEEPVAEAEAAPEDTAAEELARTAAERDEFFDQLQRSRAEFINYRKRTDQERLRLAEVFTSETLKQFLPVIDDFDRAIESVPENEQTSGWVTGISLIYQKLLGILERAGVEVIDSLGQPFDPAVHEAVATEPGTSGQLVVEVYQKGYRLGDTLLRPAMVKMGDAPAETVGSSTNTKTAFDA
jgi:molecular chaperone GrpE